MNDDRITISCDDCALASTAACDDCVVSFLLGPPASSEDAVIVDVIEARAMRMLHDAGLVPELRFEPMVS